MLVHFTTDKKCMPLLNPFSCRQFERELLSTHSYGTVSWWNKLVCLEMSSHSLFKLNKNKFFRYLKVKVIHFLMAIPHDHSLIARLIKFFLIFCRFCVFLCNLQRLTVIAASDHLAYAQNAEIFRLCYETGKVRLLLLSHS